MSFRRGAGFLALAVSALLVGCSTGSTGGTTSGNLTVGYEADATSLDAAQPTDINTMQVLTQMYDTLVQWGTDKNLQPGLATDWKTSSDGLTYTFNLRSGVKFANGDPLTADDVAFTFDRMLDQNSPGYQYGPFPFGAFFFGAIKQSKAVSPTQVELSLSSPDAGFLASLTVITAGIVDKKAALAAGKDFANTGMGSGPFMLDKWTRGQQLVLKVNPNYWGPKPKLSSITWLPIVQPNQRSVELKSGDINLALNPTPATLADLKSQGFTVNMAAGPHIWWVGVNISKPPFNKVGVRQAMNYAIDRNAIVKGILYDTGVAANQPLAPGQVGFNANVDNYDYNPTKAKQLLAAAGYPNGFTTTMLVPTSGSGMQEPQAMGTAIQGYLKAIGITVNIQEIEWGTFLNKIGQGAQKANMDMWELSWMDSAVDPWLVLNPLLVKGSWPPGYNTGFYENPEVDRLLTEGLAEQDPQKRDQLYQQAEALINKDAAWIFVDHAKEVVVTDKSVQNFALNPVFPFLIHLRDVGRS